ncbi:TIGR03621 family F420-dependent LLM class oxidoreductase [Thermobifida halotolerans]|uniref:TIGR03621 family F420-dependent LLM class oxidoreductase n=1 Tax=Thermobifida halotolerans TaxID=483545 RepID=A0A399G2V7_9ACTN|nr:TIGR03621 family F420-dependent LLM class oxidoreductase [Thermobifida halotolerans]UOE20087.1 TIGR03621 family F420-dependent LLM class oxidoreductase [Thermobifida halotolerans]
MTDFRFGVNFRDADLDHWTDYCAQTEALGFDVLYAYDHLGQPDPFAMLAAAAAATTRLGLGTYVVNNEFHNPALLARAAATVDRLSGGRLELGLGAGHMKREFDDAAVPWRPYAERIERLERTIVELDRRFAAGEPTPARSPRPTLTVGGHGERILALAARHADVVAFSGLKQHPERAPGEFTVAGTDELLRRVEFVRRTAGERAGELEFSVLVQAVLLTDDPERTFAETAGLFTEAGLPDLRAVLDSPFVLLGSAEEIAREIIAHRDRFGFTTVVAHGTHRDALARVIPEVRALA